MNNAMRQMAVVVSRRGLKTSAVRQGFFKYNPIGGVPGSSLPFDIQNRWALTLKMSAYLAVSMGFPFYLLRRCLLQG